jgi:hypothetical protein
MILKKLDWILEKDVEPTMNVTMGATYFKVKMEKPLENHEINIAYWHHFQWKEGRSQARNSSKVNEICVSSIKRK